MYRGSLVLVRKGELAVFGKIEEHGWIEGIDVQDAGANTQHQPLSTYSHGWTDRTSLYCKPLTMSSLCSIVFSSMLAAYQGTSAASGPTAHCPLDLLPCRFF